jgi:serine protease Do
MSRDAMFRRRPAATNVRGVTTVAWLCAAFVVLGCGSTAPGQSRPVATRPDTPAFATPDQQTLVFRAALARVGPSIVRIETIGGAQPLAPDAGPMGSGGGPQFRIADGPTTGVILSADGYIITSSFNFVRNPSIITVVLADERRLVAKLIARDRPARLALLKVDARDLVPAEFAPASALRPGQWALVAGYGYGTKSPSLSIGIVSALNRVNGLAHQVDAKTSPANYGGPVFDLDGRVIGICVPMSSSAAINDELAGIDWYDSGIGFAATAERIRRQLPRLQRGEDAERGLLGIALAPPEPPSADPASRPAAIGMRIGADPRGPAVEAGLQKGDIITHLDGIATPRLIEFRRVLWSKAAGDSIEVTYLRGERSGSATVTLVNEAYFRQGTREESDSDAPATAPAGAPASAPGEPDRR